MKKVFLSIVAIAALVALPMSVSAALEVGESAVLPATGSAKIIIPITLTYEAASPLEFGTISNGTGAAFNVVATATSDGSTTDAFVASEGVDLLTTGNPRSFAKFTVKGATGVEYKIVLPTTVDLTGSGNFAGAVSLSNFNTPTSTGITGTGEDQVFYVGAKLNASDHAYGEFSNTFNVTVQYE